jgi:hypothetical protein
MYSAQIHLKDRPRMRSPKGMDPDPNSVDLWIQWNL